GTDQIEFPMAGPSPASRGEVRAPNQDESLSSLVSGDGGGLRVRLVTGLLIAALGLGWAGLSNPYRFFKSDLTSTPVQQTAASDTLPAVVDQETASAAPIGGQGSPRTGSDLSYRVGGEPIHRADQGVVSPEDAFPSSAQKTTAMKPAGGPREKKDQYRPTPIPDTRPKTIEGWKVKHVSRGTVVLQGPDGIHKASIGRHGARSGPDRLDRAVGQPFAGRDHQRLDYDRLSGSTGSRKIHNRRRSCMLGSAYRDATAKLHRDRWRTQAASVTRQLTDQRRPWCWRDVG